MSPRSAGGGRTAAAQLAAGSSDPAVPSVSQDADAGADALDLTCYLYPGWSPRIRPAPSKRAWMDATPESFAYRCLPLNIANSHGWEVLSPCDFEATWDGSAGTDGVTIKLLSPVDESERPVSLFGQGTITFHIMGLFRTPPGWNLWVGGAPNYAKDGIQALTGVIETDWSPFTFTMNWRFTRPNHPVRFRTGDPICFFFPVQRNALEAVTPRFAPIENAPELKAGFEAWSQGRDAFQAGVKEKRPSSGSAAWQKHYYRGVDTTGRSHVDDHRSKLRLADFAGRPARMPRPEAEPLPDAPAPTGGVCPARGPGAQPSLDQRKRDWILDAMESMRSLSPANTAIDYVEGMTRNVFLDSCYALNRPVVLGGELEAWPASTLWTPDYLKQAVGAAEIEYQGDRSGDPAFELAKDNHKRTLPFDAFIDRITRDGAGNDAYLTAYNSARNQAALAPLRKDVRTLTKYLTPQGEGMMWIGPAGTFTPLHHDLTNNFMVQVVGRKRVLLCPPSESQRLFNFKHVFSAIGDLENPSGPPQVREQLAKTRVYAVDLEPGDILFIPLGWWHQVRSQDFSVTITHTNFLWRNDYYESYPSDQD